MICPSCFGCGKVDFEKCDTCGGAGTIPQNSCPVASVDSQEDASLFRAALKAKNGLWPVAGGLMDQPCFIVDAVEVVNLIDGVCAERRAKEQEQKNRKKGAVRGH
jgi:RecJ-like exonuclease